MLGIRKTSPKEVLSKLRTKRQVRICPTERDPSKTGSIWEGPWSGWLVDNVKHKRQEEGHRVWRPGLTSRWACQGNLPGLGDLSGSSIHRIPATSITRPLDQIPGP